MSQNFRRSRHALRFVSTQQSGFGLIEILVALLILAIGLLGMASLQTASLQQTTGSQARTQAIFLAEDLVERIRANRQNINDYALIDPDAVACNTGFAIDNSGVAEDDLDEWRNSLACLLPGGNGEVSVNGNRVTVDLMWSSREDVADLDDGALTLEVAL
ncbi:type IV pilus modification protein PilV [Marinobacter vulgaris]|uniref:Type IV pilus modification protein PilV n=1 Tax=Marinobacter vulgaris TaxID=1928331 RepID=A0A2V3ZHL8_9GAMM|nr:type IV pilus modification protein PilV [Marinobacter vulgaris]PXX89376.1 type IV pilus modification protein PilV [Marinobacter vulgaris]TSJ68059.1 type IV pilus modification protein PilV [Marinobacter vulgaris]